MYCSYVEYFDFVGLYSINAVVHISVCSII
uniref:Uncharacterized protein n=1 Tax=Arundo donax TaxID=35708 RepID=A0A0A9BBJ0_ARUDO